MDRNGDIERLSDEKLRAELQRRVSIFETDFINDLGDLPAGAWNQEPVKPRTDNSALRAEWDGIARLALARIREMLAIPLDPTDSNYGATLRGINSAISTGLTFLSKINSEMLQPPKRDMMPEIRKLIEETQQRLFEKDLPKLVRELILLNDDQIDELLQKRREHLQWDEKRAHELLDSPKDVDA